MRYPELPASLLEVEDQVLATWRDEDLFRKTLAANAGGEPFVFFEGPPTANGRPGLHHIISRTIKDLVCRHKAMEGRSVTRIAGWDTHGLPVEIEAEKKLGISGKPEIEALGIAEFNQACRDSVFTYKEEWEQLSERIGYWLEYWRPYVTLDPTYIESVWWILKRFADEGLLYKGHKSVPYCPRCGTALSSHEVALGYRDVEDPSLVFVAPVVDEAGVPDADGRAFLAWTTTPWTVPSNTALAVHPSLTYVEVARDARRYIVAEERAKALFGEHPEVVARHSGASLAGWRYSRPLDLVPAPTDPGNGWTVVAEEFVTATDGTGIVHVAPAFGADDYQAGQRHGLPLLNPVDDAGHFTEDVAVVGGTFVKDADPVLVEELKKRGRLFDIGRVVHSYPHCWRCSSPLLYVARDSWFAATSRFRDELLRNNEQISWYPPEVGEGRFGEWLRGNVDWALSRDRYWGTPLPVWVCDRAEGHVQWIGSLAELGEASGGLPEGFDPHRPYIDELTWPCGECGGTMRRTPEVLDAWFDSGAMPYAQWHYPFENQDELEAHYPADFICEGLDQTRGWFYSLLAISTLLGREPAYKNVLVNDMVLDAEGQKMSKSRGNMADPWKAIGEHGADAVRWYFITSSNPWLPKRYDPEGVGEAARRFFDTLLNTYKFFALYARAEEWAPSEADPKPAERPLLDRWLLSRLRSLVLRMKGELDAYQLTRAYRALGDFVVEDLSNWYVRRSRARFWGNVDAVDTRAAFRTLWEALREVALLAAPCVPFSADWLHRALTGESVHLQRYPAVAAHAEGGAVDAELEAAMDAARMLVSLGRAAREEAKIRVRQPLRTMQAVVPGARSLPEDVLAVVRDELNVKEVAFLESAEGIVTLVARPNYRALGSRFGKRTNDVANAIRALSQEALSGYREGERVEVAVDGEPHALEEGDVDVAQEATAGLVVKAEGGYTVALDPALDDDLLAEGLARELVNRIQRLRKDAGLEITDRIELAIGGPEAIQEAARRHETFIGGETLALAAAIGGGVAEDFPHVRDVDIDGTPARIGLRLSAHG
ncbi:MAG TPA: isoleucine--tRNA ligase [Longimicrobiales bacterium]|nr:isoleucine--tRNA ligase [Longimicrobiales bacterium]